MQEYKNFTKDGNVYKLKPQWGINIPLIGAFVLLTIIGFTKSPGSSFRWWMLGFFIILFISVLRSYLLIDLDKKEIWVKNGLFGGEKIIPLADFQGFTINKLKQFGLITINVSLTASYTINGKDREVMLAQSFFTKPIQSILNDMDEILSDEQQR